MPLFNLISPAAVTPVRLICRAEALVRFALGKSHRVEVQRCESENHQQQPLRLPADDVDQRIEHEMAEPMSVTTLKIAKFIRTIPAGIEIKCRTPGKSREKKTPPAS